MKVVITGAPGTGKTTLIKRIYSLNPQKFKGFWTEEIREKGKRVGFKIVTTDGRSGILSHVKIDSPYRVGRYKVDIKGFEDLVFPYLVPDGRIILIDEIGKMELFSERFARLVEDLMFDGGDVIATIPLKDVHPLVKRIRRIYNPIEITIHNRDMIFSRIKKLLKF